MIQREAGVYLTQGDELGGAKPKDRKEEFLSQIIQRLNELFITEGLTEKDLVNYARTIRDKVMENEQVMNQIRNNAPEQAKLGTYPDALMNAILDGSDVHDNQKFQLLSNEAIRQRFGVLIFDDILRIIRQSGVCVQGLLASKNP